MNTTRTAKGLYYFHEDRNVTSQLLNLRISFHWRAAVDDELVKTFREWNTPPYDATPDYIVMGLRIKKFEYHFSF